MHYAVHGNTAAEVIFNRVDSGKENIGLINFKGNMPTRAEKDYLEIMGEDIKKVKIMLFQKAYL